MTGAEAGTGRRLRALGIALLLFTESLALAAARLPTEATLPEEPAAQNRRFEAETISLSEALHRTVELATAVELADAEAIRLAGAALEETGIFDWALNFRTVYDVGRGELLPNQIQAEINRREAQRVLRDDIGALAEALQRVLEADGTAFPECVSAIVFVNGFQVCVEDVDFARGQTLQEFVDLLILQAEDPDRRAGLEGIRDTQTELLRRQLSNALVVLRNVAESGRQSVINLGVLPEIAKRYGFLLDLQATKIFRTGLTLQAGMILESVEDNFEGKPLSPTFGGSGIPTTYTSFLGFQVSLPLRKGAGPSAAAPERAARLSHQAARLQAVQTANASAEVTVQAYWRLVAAQERLRIFELSVDREADLQKVVGRMIDANELPAFEKSRAAARLATSKRDAAAARQEVFTRRIELAQAIGLSVDDPRDAPLTGDPFPPLPPTGPTVENLGRFLGEAVHRRRDVQALHRFEEAAETLRQAAKHDLKSRLDLTFAFGYSGLHETFRMRSYEVGGFWDAVTGKHTGPSARLFLKWELPFGNRGARGRLQQATAVKRRSAISARDRSRQTRLGILGSIQSLEKSAAELEQQLRSAQLQTRVLEDSIERLRLGESPLINVILTEEQLTTAELAVTDARLAYASLLTRLQAEAGLLVTADSEGGAFQLKVAIPAADLFAECCPAMMEADPSHLSRASR